ncbi:hypothetical protein [Asaia sp. HN010]|uniref:hypothetical protein n=1 Tax=Asaia sp. HN010 TaxID=3081233 RepID=UPI003019C3C9
MSRSNAIDEADLCGAVNRWVDKFPSGAEAARSLGMSPQALNAQRNAVKPYSPRVLAAAGLRRVVTVHYEFIEDTRS